MAVVAALISGIMSLEAGKMGNIALSEAQDEARKLGERERQDTLARTAAEERYRQQALGQQSALQREQMNLSEKMQSAQLAQQDKRDAATRSKERYDRALSLINNNAALKNRMRQLLGGN